MKAMILKQTCNLSENLLPLEMAVLPDPEPTEDQILIKISACGVCHTELDEIEGRTPPAFFPMILGHEVVGRVILAGKKASRF
ncbi:MAG: alcohol dehydrogenase catalytic domain-containing protein, partial [Candidatus Cloacimonetes bacterium]|nr:alcohol dehydrogenase catalytic domain-containing protein [Candidatus Cloacimonadota bacterium]